MEFAQFVAEQLGRFHRQAEAVPALGTPQGDLIVTGRITHIHGGSTAKRWLIGYGAGHSAFGVEGQVVARDATNVADFSEDRAGSGLGGNEGALRNAMQRVGVYVARMIYLNEYRGGRPGSPGMLQTAAKPSEPSRATTLADRLRELDEARAKGLVSDEEYQTKRRAIIESF